MNKIKKERMNYNDFSAEDYFEDISPNECKSYFRSLIRFQIYPTNDIVPISKLKRKHITLFFKKFNNFKKEILKQQENPKCKIFIEYKKTFIIINDFCFVFIYKNKPSIKNKILDIAYNKI